MGSFAWAHGRKSHRSRSAFSVVVLEIYSFRLKPFNKSSATWRKGCKMHLCVGAIWLPDGFLKICTNAARVPLCREASHFSNFVEHVISFVGRFKVILYCKLEVPHFVRNLKLCLRRSNILALS